MHSISLTPQTLHEKLTEAKSSYILDLTGYSFEEEIFNSLDAFLLESPKLSRIYVSKSLLKAHQIKKILEIVNGNLMKGVKLLDEENKPFGSAYTDWHQYNLEKKEACKLNETTLEALRHFSTPPMHVIDFGAGTGQETIALLKQGCASVTAIDGDEEAVEILKGRASQFIKEGRLEIYKGPFLEYEPSKKADLFLSSFTWPYRPKKDFQACFEKTVSCVKEGGFIAGHFFGIPNEPEPAIAYHTKNEIYELLKDDFEKISIREEVHGNRKIYGGTTPPWNILYHVVAKKKTSLIKCF